MQATDPKQSKNDIVEEQKKVIRKLEEAFEERNKESRKQEQSSLNEFLKIYGDFVGKERNW